MRSEEVLESPLGPLPNAVRRFAHVLIDAGHASYLVGGAVRNILQDRPPGDWDIATDATPDRVQGLYRRTIPTGIRHGTVTVLFGRDRFEVTTFRTDAGYSDGRRPDSVRFTGTIEEDLARRDFTINAIAFDLATGVLYDPHGGRGDLAARRLRTVGSARERFAEDGLRPFRGCRLAAELTLTVDRQTVRAIRDARPIARRVAVERVCEELRRLLLAPTPSAGLRLLERSGLLELCLPEEDGGAAGSAAERVARYARIDAAPAEVPLRLAMLLAPVNAADIPAACERAQAALIRLRFPHAVTRRVVVAIGSLAIPISTDSSDADIRRLLATVGRGGAADAVAVRRAIAQIDPPLARRVHRLAASGQALTVGELAVDGTMLQRELGLRQGPRIGRLLRALLGEVLADPAANERSRLLDAAKALQRSGADPAEPDSLGDASVSTSRE